MPRKKDGPVTLGRVGIASELAKKVQIPKSWALQYVNAMIDIMQESLIAGQGISINGFGALNLSKRSPFTGQNPRTGEPVEVGARTVVVFRGGKTLRKALNPDAD